MPAAHLQHDGRRGGAAPAAKPPQPRDSSRLGDLRFRGLLPSAAWASLPEAVRRRFCKRVDHGRTVVYVGEVTETRLSAAGRLLASATRVIGSPFPNATDSGLPAVVSVGEDVATGGQIWTRLYARDSGFPQVIRSCKRFGGPTGLEEHVGGGAGMTLTVHVEDGALVFRSDRYFLDLLGRRLWLPAVLTPGNLSVTHRERGDGRFSFTLQVTHPRLGQLVWQRAVFREVAP